MLEFLTPILRKYHLRIKRRVCQTVCSHWRSRSLSLSIGKLNHFNVAFTDRSKRSSKYSGYRLSQIPEPDGELTRIGPGTICGEYFRRYWHPVAMTRQLGDLPKLIRIMGEDLVLFRDRSDRLGLVHRHCPHRNASLEYGMCEDRGIRCCYHGWLFDVDGTILEVPGQPIKVSQKICGTLRLGAYPTREYKGLIFAYMGPPEKQPEFPLYDTFDLPGMEMVPYTAHYRCNWLQVLDAIVDPIHTSFLHSRASRPQFSQQLGELGVLSFYHRPLRLIGLNTRRVNDHIWARVNEMVFPNFTQAGAAFATDGTAVRYFGRSAFTRWVVPVDDHNTVALAWANFGERGDPPQYNTADGPELIEQGEVIDRSYEERQRFPGDAEAVEGMGPISVHKREHLLPSDKGVAMLRRQLKNELHELKQGNEPAQPMQILPTPVPTYGSDTVLRLPKKEDADDSSYLQAVGDKIMDILFAADRFTGAQRDEWLFQQLKDLETRGSV